MVLYSGLNDIDRANTEASGWKEVENKGGINVCQCEQPIIKITFHLCLKKRLQNIKLNNFGV